jgi:hypothetical protein
VKNFVSTDVIWLHFQIVELSGKPHPFRNGSAKFAAVYVRPDTLTKPMLIFNADETGISKAHKPRRKVIAGQGVC